MFSALKGAGGDLYERYHALRSRSPCFFDEGAGSFLLTRHVDVLGVLRNPDAFSSKRPAALRKSRLSDGVPIVLLTDDPPRHTAIRALVNRPFAAKALAGLDSWLESLVERLLDATNPAAVDIIAALAEPLPVMTVARMLGVAPDDWMTFKRWSSAAAGLLESGSGEHLRDMLSFLAYFGAAIEARRACPRDDLISGLIERSDSAQVLNDAQMRSLCVLLLMAGSETTTNLIGNTFAILAERPDLWQALREGSVPTTAVIEEALRFDSPIQIVSRVATADVEVNGLRFRCGDVVAACLGAANRDPDAFDAPDVFDPRRDTRRHLGFAHGVHFCLGAALARMEAQAVLKAALRRYRRLQRLSPDRRIDSPIVRGFVSLGLRFDG